MDMMRTCYRMDDVDSSAVTLRSQFVSSQITCLEFVEQFLFAGEGSWLHVFHVTPVKVVYITKCKVFKALNVHGIKSEKCDRKCFNTRLCVFGGRCMVILRVSWNSDSVSFNTKSSVIKFQDWIWDVQWLNNGCVALVMAQNYVLLWDPIVEKEQKVSKCLEKCILYCGLFVGTDWEAAAIFSGTVFKEILIWCPNENSSQKGEGSASEVLHRLKGHDGVIFCITYHEKLRKLCSSSDDRSIQIWHHELKCEISPNVNMWKRSDFIFLHRLYGHEARVWKAAALHNFYISAGEDSLLCIWNGEESNNKGTLVKKILCHAGSSIRSLCVNNTETILVTGGGDGSIKLWSLSDNEYQSLNILDSVSFSSSASSINKIVLPPDYPRELYIVNDRSLLIMTNDGILLGYDMMNDITSICMKDPRFRSYSVIDVIDVNNNTVVCVGDIAGGVTLFKTGMDACFSSDNTVCLGYSPVCNGKLFALKWINQTCLLTCGSQGQMTLWNIQIDDCCLRPECVLELPKSRQRWFSTAKAVIQINKMLLICGCRDGSIHVYSIEDNSLLTSVLSPIQSFPQLHGCNGVTDIICHKDGVYTSGRDGFVVLFEIMGDCLTILTKQWVTGCPKWISGVMELDDDTLIYGFHSSSFILWSEKQQIALWEVPCGGGHRSWSFKFHHDMATFAYIKGRDIEFCKGKIKSTIPVSVKSGFHKRATCSIQYLFTMQNKIVCITASEDTTLGIISFQETENSYCGTVDYTLKGHISSVKATAYCPWQETLKSRDILLVSVGGRAQMMCWRITAINDESRDCKQTLRIQEISSHMLNPERRNVKKPWKKQTISFDPETRYMDVAVWPLHSSECEGSLYLIATACSDSYLSLNVTSGVMKLLTENPLHGHCMLKIKFCRICNDEFLLITTGTDGKAIFWQITNIELSYPENASVKNNLINKEHFKSATDIQSLSEVSLAELQLHQSGITALAVIQKSETADSQTLLMATGGDDTAISISTLEIKLTTSLNELSTNLLKVYEVNRVTINVVHTAQITGLHFFTPQFLASSCVDQRICIWHNEHTETNEFKLKFYELSNIPDIASLTGWTDGENTHYICVGGRGLELCKMTLGPEF